MTRILSYNILMGAARRVEQLTSIIRTANPDIVGLVEAMRPDVVKELARRLEMHYVLNTDVSDSTDQQVALLSRYPVLSAQAHIYSDILARPVLEVCIEEPDGQQLTAFVAHLSAAFSQKRAGDTLRRQELRHILRIMSTRQGTPHLLMGDFNSLAPGDAFHASNLLRYVVMLDQHYQHNALAAAKDGHPHLNFVVPPRLRLFNPLLQAIPRSKLLCSLFDKAGAFYVSRGTIALIRSAGYVDCFRQRNPFEKGFTCPAAAPAGRIDFIFASPELAQRLNHCYVATEGDGVSPEKASDHLAVVADFDKAVEVEGQMDGTDIANVGSSALPVLRGLFG